MMIHSVRMKAIWSVIMAVMVVFSCKSRSTQEMSTVDSAASKKALGKDVNRFLSGMGKCIKCDLRGLRFRGSSRDFILVNISGSDLTDADLRHSSFEGANFSGVSFKGADLSCGNFKSGNFSGADLSTANLRGANFKGARLLGTKLPSDELMKDTQFAGALPGPINKWKLGDRIKNEASRPDDCDK